jgi:hypothetical protein
MLSIRPRLLHINLPAPSVELKLDVHRKIIKIGALDRLAARVIEALLRNVSHISYGFSRYLLAAACVDETVT